MTTATVVASAAAPPTPEVLAGWTHRIRATVERVPASDLPGEETAVTTFRTGGVAAADGRDIRVAAADGSLQRFRILQKGPGDRVRIAFALTAGVTDYDIYLGNPDAPAPGENLRLEIRRGVLMESWAYAGGPIQTLEQTRQAFARAKKLLGRDFRPNVFIGHNPFSGSRSTCTRFTGWLRLPRDRRCTFVISSRDASFLLVDGEAVIENGGRHGPQRDYSKTAVVDLDAGLHRLEMLHVTLAGSPIAVLAWRKDGRGRALPVPSIAFAPVAKAVCGPLWRRGAPAAVDFGVNHVGETFAKGRYYQRFVFSERFSETSDVPATFTWDFGDGQKARGATVEHVYLTDGVRTVTLTIGGRGGRRVRRHRVGVWRDWDRVTRRVVESVRPYGQLVRGYDFAALPAADAASAASLLGAIGAVDEVLALAETVAAAGASEPNVHREVFAAAAEVYRQTGRSEQAADLLARAVAGARDETARGALEVLAGEVILNDLRQPERAAPIFEGVIDRCDRRLHTGVLWRAWVGLGDVRRARGDYAGAAEAYRKARPAPMKPRDEAVLRGRLAFDAETFLRDDQLERAADALDRWDAALPADRLTGYSTLLRTRLLAATDRHADAAAEAEILLGVNPDSAYAPNLLLAVAAAELQRGRTDQARRALRRLVEGYPESALAAAAADRLAALDAPARRP